MPSIAPVLSGWCRRASLAALILMCAAVVVGQFVEVAVPRTSLKSARSVNVERPVPWSSTPAALTDAAPRPVLVVVGELVVVDPASRLPLVDRSLFVPPRV